jgi:hypothetical protein
MKPKPTDAVNEEKTEIDDIFAEVGRIYRTPNLTQLDLEKLDQCKTAIKKLIAQEANKARIEELRNLPYINPEWETFEYINERIAELKVIQNKLEGLQDE